MKKTWKSSVLLLGTAMLGAAALSGTNAMAQTDIIDVPVTAEITQSIVADKSADFEFGTIQHSPTGESSITVDASAGPLVGAAPGSANVSKTGNSVFDNVTSGQIKVTAPFPMDIYVTYPAGDKVILKNDDLDEIELTDIAANSTALGTSDELAALAGDTFIDLGGKLTLPDNTPVGEYSGDLTVSLTYH